MGPKAAGEGGSSQMGRGRTSQASLCTPTAWASCSTADEFTKAGIQRFQPAPSLAEGA